MSADLQTEDMQFLNAQPQFRRFLWRVIQMAGILAPATNGADGRDLSFAEGRRNLGFEILADAEMGQPIQHHESLMTLLQVLREEAQQSEKPNGRRKPRYDRNDDLADGDERDVDG